MPHNYFFKNQPLSIGKVIVIDEQEELKHARVMRLQPNQCIAIINGRYQKGKATVLEVTKKTIVSKVCEVENYKHKLRKLSIVQPYLKSNKSDLIIEKLTELGVDEILFFCSQLTNIKHFSQQHTNRHHRIIISAMKQSGRVDLPTIKYKHSIDECISDKDQLLYCHLNNDSIPVFNIPLEDRITCVIGSEQGFSTTELDIVKKRGLGITINHNILRAETAAISAASIITSRIL